MRGETSTIITNNYPGELITFLNLNLPPAFKGAVGELLLLFLSTFSHTALTKISAMLPSLPRSTMPRQDFLPMWPGFFIRF